MEFNIYVLIMAVFSLATGLTLYVWLALSNASYFYSTNVASWLLIALFPVLLVFSFFFPESSFAGTIKGVSMGGAIGAFIFIWWYGTKIAMQASQVDNRVEKIRTDLSAELEAREEELARLKELLEEDRRQRAPSVLQETKTYPYRLIIGEQSKRITLITGDIRRVKVADVWVNSTNTNMHLDYFYVRSISAIIRYLGAKKDNVGNVSEDVIANELAEVMGNNLYVQPATVLVTGAGELQRTHNVKKIFHVASVHGEIGVGYRPIHNIEYCVANALKKGDSEELRSLGFKAILFPLMGAGSAKGNLKEIAEKLIHAAISYMETTEDSTIESVYFLTWTDIELDTCKEILEESDKLTALES